MSLKGKRVVEIRRMTDEEMKYEYWWPRGIEGAPAVIVFDDGSKVYPSKDPEGNGPGALFGEDKKGNKFILS